MTETKEREAYRKACRHYGVDGNCHKQSHAERIYGYYFAVDVACTPDCGCARMKRYDKDVLAVTKITITFEAGLKS